MASVIGRVLDAGRRRGQDPLGPTSTAPRRLPDTTLGVVWLKGGGTREIPTISRVLSILCDEELEAFQRVEQLCESDFESMVAPQFLTDEHRGENIASPFGVGLEVSDPLPASVIG